MELYNIWEQLGWQCPKCGNLATVLVKLEGEDKIKYSLRCESCGHIFNAIVDKDNLDMEIE